MYDFAIFLQSINIQYNTMAKEAVISVRNRRLID